ncbi:hypothetical protein DY000_02013368 [Brassica cretica]|uniref:Uncharacterized protein n=1 Tax=Brassica cretica TaxID=69181 RepID=A0ABQ7DDZ0_BRACR|nr:hypothetical protein DY000_02013368 [Brassica cretica]
MYDSIKPLSEEARHSTSRRSAPRGGRGSSASSSRPSGSSHEQNSVPAYVPAPYVPTPAAQEDPGVMSVQQLVQQPGREHLPVLHPNPRPGHTTWFDKSSNGISRSINNMMYSMLHTGYSKWSVIPREDRELWFRRSEEARHSASRCSAPRGGRGSSASSSRPSGSSHEQNSVPAYVPAPAPAPYVPAPAAQEDPGVMSVQQPGREHLPVLHPNPRLGHTTWFDKSSNGISRSINNMMYFMLHTGYSKWSVIPREDRELWFRQFADAVIRSVVDLVETQKEALLSSQPLSNDGDSTGASTNMFRLQAVPKRKGGRLVGLARRASSYPASSSQVPYTDPMILEQLQNKDERIVALEEQNATILSENATILAQLESQKKTNAEILEKLDRLSEEARHSASRRSAPRGGRGSSASSSRPSGSSHEQNSVPAYVPAPAPAPAPAPYVPAPAAQEDPGVMPVQQLVQYPGREHLPVLHPNPRPGHTTWFNKSSNGISRSINNMMYSMLHTGYSKWSVIPGEDRELWFRQFADAVIRSVVNLVETQKEDLLSSQPLSDDGDSTGASTNMFRLQINEMVEKVIF